MSAFAEMVVEGFVSLLRSLTGAAEEAASESPELQKKIRQAKQKAERLVSKKAGHFDASTKTENSTETESINVEEFRQHRNAKLLPQIKHVSKKPEADRRFDWYEKHGFIEQCLKQRAERLQDD